MHLFHQKATFGWFFNQSVVTSWYTQQRSMYNRNQRSGWVDHRLHDKQLWISDVVFLTLRRMWRLGLFKAYCIYEKYQNPTQISIRKLTPKYRVYYCDQNFFFFFFIHHTIVSQKMIVQIFLSIEWINDFAFKVLMVAKSIDNLKLKAMKCNSKAKTKCLKFEYHESRVKLHEIIDTLAFMTHFFEVFFSFFFSPLSQIIMALYLKLLWQFISKIWSALYYFFLIWCSFVRNIVDFLIFAQFYSWASKMSSEKITILKNWNLLQMLNGYGRAESTSSTWLNILYLLLAAIRIVRHLTQK